MTHSPAPWTVEDDDKQGQPWIASRGGALVAIVAHECVKPREELDANARLIATAPAGLALAQAVLEWWQSAQFEEYGGGDGDIPRNRYDDDPPMVKQARAIVAACGVKP